MATSLRCARCVTRTTAYHLPCKARRRFPIHPFRTFSSAPAVLARQNPRAQTRITKLPPQYYEPDPEEEDEFDDEEGDGDEDGDERGSVSVGDSARNEQTISEIFEKLPNDPDADPAAALDALERLEKIPTSERQPDLGNLDEIENFEQQLNEGRFLDDPYDDDGPYEEEPLYERGFFAHDEEKDDPGPDPEFDMDDLTSLGHANLEQVREMRELARCIVWDMPLLYNHARPFVPPTTAQPLRWRYTTYMGEDHPASRKVQVTFLPRKLDSSLTDVQQNKLIKLLGDRYNPETEQARMSCELHATTAQNKRHLGDLIETLIAEAKDPADTFEDVPFDFRHHRPRKMHVFPEEWKLTAERKKALDQKRRAQIAKAEQRALNGEVVDGKLLLEGVREPAREAVRVEARQPARVRR